MGFKDLAVKILLTIAEDSKQDYELRSECAFTVGESKPEYQLVINRLLNIVEDDNQDIELRGACAFAVGRLGEKETGEDIVLVQLYREKEDKETYWALWELTAV